MFAKLVFAAVVTLSVSPAALAGPSGPDAGNNTVISLGKVDASNPADVARVKRAIAVHAREVCTITGSLIPSAVCVRAFTQEAYASLKSRDLQIALGAQDATGGGMPRAAAPVRE